MDIAGAKALKRRLGPNAADEVLREADIAAEVPADAPPVYRWTGVSKKPSTAPPAPADDEPQDTAASMFRRLGLSFR